MKEVVCLNPKYSTTRRLTRKQHIIKSIPNEKYKNKLIRGNENKYPNSLRSEGYFKIDEPEKPLISIITVVRNGVDLLEKTIESVINQTYKNW